jgi:serine/threonine protein kinase
MPSRTGQQLGNYHLIRTLAEGGFAEVYLGEHVHLGINAAIKVLHAQLTSEDLKQFREEARSIARLRHPHIVTIFDFDVNGDVPFLVMEYAPNGTLSQRHPRGSHLSPTTILSYLRQISGALQYAHDQRLVHRDVKPENMLIGERGEILLSDFGIAVVASATTQDVVGTPAYIAPEQIEGKPLPASDQYALGIVVYQWLCGTYPFHGTSGEITVKHLSAPPPSLCEQLPDLPPGIEQVVQKALAKKPQERYASVQDFANAFEAAILPPSLHLPEINTTGEPVVSTRNFYLDATIPVHVPVTATQAASPPSAAPEKTHKRLPSRRSVLLCLTALATTAVAGTGVSWLAHLSSITHARSKVPSPTPTSIPTATPIPAGTLLRSYYGHFGYVYTVSWSPDGTYIASGSEDHTVHLWKASTGADILFTYSHQDAVHAVAWSPDGALIASASSDKTVQVWKAADESSVYTYTNHSGGVRAAAWSPDGTLIASGGSDATVQVWKAVDGSGGIIYSGHIDIVNAVAWSPDGTLIASGSSDKTVHVWKAADGSDVLAYGGHSDVVNTVAWSPNGTLLASGSADKTVQIWKASDGTNVLTYSNHSDAVNVVAWKPVRGQGMPNGILIASGSNDKTVQVWQAQSA